MFDAEYDVIHLVRIFHPNIGGMENLVHEVAVRQVAQGKKVLVVTSDVMRDGEKINVHLDRDYEVLRVKAVLIRGIFFPFDIFADLPSCNQLHCHGMDPFVDLLSFKIRKRSFIISPHGGFFHTKKLNVIKKVYFNTISRFIASKSPKYLCISRNDMDLVSKISSDVYFMGCGSNDVPFVPGGGGALLFGRISKNKSVNDAIELFCNNFDSGDLTIAGPNPENLTVNTGVNVKYIGCVSDEMMFDLIHSSKFFISMSTYEGLGMALIEAIKGGLIPIVRRIDAYEHIDQLIRERTKGISSIVFVDAKEEIIGIGREKKVDDEMLEVCSEAAKQIWSWDKVVQKLDCLEGGA